MMEDPPVAHEAEVVPKARRPRFTAAEKLRVLRAAYGRTKSSELGAPLRREKHALIHRGRADAD